MPECLFWLKITLKLPNHLDEQHYPFVLPCNVRMPTPTWRVRIRCKPGLATHNDDLPDSNFFGFKCENGNMYILDHHHDNDYSGRPSTLRPIGSGFGSCIRIRTLPTSACLYIAVWLPDTILFTSSVTCHVLGKFLSSNTRKLISDRILS
jgi:hypothetical protein